MYQNNLKHVHFKKYLDFTNLVLNIINIYALIGQLFTLTIAATAQFCLQLQLQIFEIFSLSISHES